MSELKKFRMVSTRPDTIWRGKEIGKGHAKLVLAGESEDDVRWFFSKIDWTSWELVAVEQAAPVSPVAQISAQLSNKFPARK